MRIPSEAFHRPGGGAPGVYALSLLDVAGSFALYSVIDPMDLHVTIELSTHFLHPVTGDRLWAVGEVERTARNQAFARAEAFDSDGRPCVVARGTWAVTPESPHALLRDLVEDPGAPRGLSSSR